MQVFPTVIRYTCFYPNLYNTLYLLSLFDKHHTENKKRGQNTIKLKSSIEIGQVDLTECKLTEFNLIYYCLN